VRISRIRLSDWLFPQSGFQPFRQEAAHSQSHLTNSVRVYYCHLFGNVDFNWQRQGFGCKGWVLQPVFQNVPKGICQKVGEAHLPRGLIVCNALQQQFQRQSLPAVEGIAIEAQQVPQSVVGGKPFVQKFPGSERAPTLPELREIQQRLTALGFDTGGTDGRVGNDTMKAVQDFQRKIGPGFSPRRMRST
jgi:hypothetical protein